MKKMQCVLGTILGAALVLPGLVSHARAETWPGKPVKLVVSQPPGGTMDIVARQVSEKLRQSKGWNIVIENKAGANGIIATQAVARATPDGYTLILASGVTHTINPYLYAKVGYDAVKDFLPIANLVEAPNVISVNASMPVHSLAELLDLARAQPGVLNYASAGTGGTGQLSMELLKTTTKTNITHVPYQGIAAAVQDTIAGRTQMVAFPPAALITHIKAGSLRPLAVTSARRSAVLPDVPTVAELGFTGFEGVAWYGIMAPTGIPANVAVTVRDALRQVMLDPTLLDAFAAQGLESNFLASADFSAYIARDAQRWQRVIKVSGAKVE